MGLYNITYFINDTNGCGCEDHDHQHDHTDSCDCGHNHEESSCGCGHNHEHNHSEEEVDSEMKIRAKIRSFGAWAQVMPESFVVKSDLSAKAMYDELKSVSNAGDILLVTKIDAADVAYSNEALLEWLSK